MKKWCCRCDGKGVLDKESFTGLPFKEICPRCDGFGYVINKEYERLARIGVATEKAFEKTHQAMFVTYWQEEEGGEHYVDTNCSFNFDGVDDLLEWAEREGE